MTVTVLRALLEEKRLRSIHDVLSMYNPVDLAELLSELDDRELAMVFRILDKPKAAEVFSYMDNDLRQELIKTFSSAEIKSLFEELFADDAADFLSDMPANFVTQLLENVDAETRKTINYLLQYPDDTEGCIVGIVTFDDAIGVLTEETTEDMQKMAAMEANTEPYLKTPVWKHAKHRIVWLLVLMVSAGITGAIISRYEAAFAAVPLLVAFIPMIMDTGGNCGSQSSTLIIRGLAVDELHFSDTLSILWKELRVSLIVGVALAAVESAFIMIKYNDLKLALVVSAALLCTVACAKVTGGLLPVAAKRLGLDPALMAAPLITTVVDTVAMFIYFTIASAVFMI